ncbi:Cobalt-zinc-cadmium resistance protein CzcA [compost metagenome]
MLEGSRQRLRPIVMTAAATIFALTPMAIGITGGGSFISQPLALVVIGGLLTSTLLTLVVVPVLYTIAERAGEKRAARRAAKREAEAAELVDRSTAKPEAEPAV